MISCAWPTRAGTEMRVTVVRAMPGMHEEAVCELADGATVADAVAASGVSLDGIAGYAVFGMRVDMAAALHEGDRVELLRPLSMDPKEARRRRARDRASGQA